MCVCVLVCTCVMCMCDVCVCVICAVCVRLRVCVCVCIVCVCAGALCTECAEGRGRSGDFECVKCNTRLWNLLGIAGGAMAVLVFLAGVVGMTYRSALQKKAIYSVLLKVFLSGLQFNAIVSVCVACVCVRMCL